MALFAEDIIVIRHGEGTHLTNLVWDKGAHLTENGRQQVEKTAAELLEKGYNPDNIAVVYVSPITRTRETAEVLAASGLFDPKKIQIEPRIAEPDVGNFEGTKMVNVPGKDFWDLYFAEECGGETLADVRRRVENFYLELMNKPWDGHVLLVSHGTPTREFFDLHCKERTRLNPAEAKIIPRILETAEQYPAP